MNELSRHEEAMLAIDEALRAKAAGSKTESERYFAHAYQLERQAALALASDLNSEPSRSILLRSAASLALQIGESREAEQLVAHALVGSPPQEIAEELRDLLEDIHLQRHLDLRGVSLQDSEVQMSLAGRQVGFGLAPTDDFIGRVKTFEKLVFRTAERQEGLPYRLQASPSKEIKDKYEVYLTVPRAASFAVSMKIGRPKEQAELPFASDVSGVIEEILLGLELVESEREDDLAKRIVSPEYFNNFVALARELAPKSRDISVVGFTALDHGKERRVALRRPRNEIKSPTRSLVDREVIALASMPVAAMVNVSTENRVDITGELRYADDTLGASGQLKLLTANGVYVNVIVPPGWMNDIVKPMWGERVRVTGNGTPAGIMLEDISKAAE